MARVPSRPAAVCLALCAPLIATPAASPGADAPNFSGVWTLNRQQSDDAAARIKEAAGSQYVAGAPSWGSETLFSWSSFKEGARVDLRQFLLDGVPALASLEIEQTAVELRTIHGEDGVRIFNLTRATAGTSAATGEKVTRQAYWKGPQAVLESKTGKSRLDEVLTLVPGRDQLIHAIRFQTELFKSPLELRLVYDRAKP